MEKISEMIDGLCPEGVACRKLIDLLRQPITDGPHETPKLQDQGIPFVSVEAIHDGVVDVTKCRGYISKEYSEVCRKKYKPETDDVYMVKSASVGRVAIVGENTNFDIWSPIAAMKPNRVVIIPRFLFYSLQTNAIQKEVVFQSSTGSQPNLSMRKLERFEIPLPPLPIQQEIVRILDSFTSLITNLETELASRQKQYEYYRNKLLTFDENDDTIDIKTLGEVCEIRNGYTPSKSNSNFWEGGTVPWFRLDDVRQNGRILNDAIQHITQDAVKKGIPFKANSVIVSTTATIGEHALIEVPFVCNQQITVLTPNSKLLPKYLYYLGYDIGQWCKANVNGAGLAIIPTSRVGDCSIHIPTLKRQHEIVSTLNTFESLINNIKQELEARKKQYEYYREQLLTF